MSLKILGGEFKGRTLKSPPASPLVKPTTSLVRKAVFDICQDRVLEAHFLDLFACSGAMGIEALSRGANFTTFVEKDKKALTALHENVSLLDIHSKAKILCQDVFKILPLLKGPYDIIYLDPPYAMTKDAKFLDLLHQIDQSRFLAPSGLLFVEEGTPANLDFTNSSFQSLHFKSTRKLSNATLHLLTWDI